MPISFSLLDIIDILIITFLLYNIILLIKDTPAVQLIKGIIILFIASFVADQLGLRTINWLLKGSMAMMVFAFPIIFQPEIRRGLLKMGKKGFLINPSYFHNVDDKKIEQLINGLVMVVPMLTAKHKGALIVLEREVGLKDILETGIILNSEFSPELLYSIFMPDSPLHDGAVIIRGNKIVGANCILPLSERSDLNKSHGTRHRAALGLSEKTDALTIVVSEETGNISIALDAKITRPLEPQGVKKILTHLYQPKNISKFNFWSRKGESK
ncbi:MAG: diadenylate cyclase CdaA [Candidatus Caldatribacteriota bacterium]|nr:diadenylate cyclase CdaA [Candidatus Caldatribacteriota bacterium]